MISDECAGKREGGLQVVFPDERYPYVMGAFHYGGMNEFVGAVMRGDPWA